MPSLPPGVRRREPDAVRQQPVELRPIDNVIPFRLPRWSARDMRREVAEEFRDADRFGRGR